ncbi:MAG: hypothetical protein U1E39_10320 [Planctomycetota bacterium]
MNVAAPLPTVRGRAPRSAPATDENAHAQRPWSAADRDAAHADLARWTAMFAPRRPRCSCGWAFEDESLHLHVEPAR